MGSPFSICVLPWKPCYTMFSVRSLKVSVPEAHRSQHVERLDLEARHEP